MPESAFCLMHCNAQAWWGQPPGLLLCVSSPHPVDLAITRFCPPAACCWPGVEVQWDKIPLVPQALCMCSLIYGLAGGVVFRLAEEDKGFQEFLLLSPR